MRLLNFSITKNRCYWCNRFNNPCAMSDGDGLLRWCKDFQEKEA